MEELEALDRFKDIELKISLVLKGKSMPLSKILKLKEGDVIKFDRKVEDYLNVELNGQPFGYGELIVVNDKISLRLVDLE